MQKLIILMLALYLTGCATPPEPPQPSGDRVLINKPRENLATKANAVLVDDLVQIPSINSTQVAVPVMEKVNPHEFNDVTIQGASK